MSNETDDTNSSDLRSWVESSNEPTSDFPIQNLPYAIFRRAGSKEAFRGGVAIGDYILDLSSDQIRRLLSPQAQAAAAAAGETSLNKLMGLGRGAQSALRGDLSLILRHSFADRAVLRSSLLPVDDAEFDLPARIGDFADFYSSLHHARNAGSLLRPQSPVLPNYWWLPVGYHGRTSTIAVSGHDFVRPSGQILLTGHTSPVFAPCRRLDYEAELGIFIGQRSAQGRPVAIDDAEKHLFGLCLLNDWSARDIQTWEYQPLGPFLGKSFASTISPWVVSMDALKPFRTALRRPADAPGPLQHLVAKDERVSGALDIKIEVHLLTAASAEQGGVPFRLSSSTYADAFWSVAQLVAHKSSNGTGLQPGDF